MPPRHLPDRRTLLKGGLAATAAGAIVACEPCEGVTGPAVHSRRRVRWRLASSFPSSLDTIYGAATVLKERVEAMTEGRFEIEVYESGELVQGLKEMNAAQSGAVEVAQTAGYYNLGKSPALAFDTCVPFGLNARQQSAWLHEAGGLELVRKAYADFNVISFPCGNTGAQMGGWFKKRVTSLGDLRGLRMRIPGMGGKAMAELGVSVQNLPGSEVYQALETGVIDATDWVGPYDDEKLGFYQVAKQYHYPGWWEPGPSLSFLVNLDAWNDLSSGDQAVFRAASDAAAQSMMNRYDAKNPAALQRLVANGVQLVPFSADLIAGAQEASEQLLRDEAAKDKDYAALFQHWRAFRTDSFAWFGTAERAYMDAVMGN